MARSKIHLEPALDRRRLEPPAYLLSPWITKDMKAKVDLSDKDAVYEILDHSEA